MWLHLQKSVQLPAGTEPIAQTKSQIENPWKAKEKKKLTQEFKQFSFNLLNYMKYSMLKDITKRKDSMQMLSLNNTYDNQK